PAARSAAWAEAIPTSAHTAPDNKIETRFISVPGLFYLREIGGNIQHILIRQAFCDSDHGRESPGTGFVLFQCSNNVIRILARNHGNPIDFGKAGAVFRNTMTTNTHGNFTFGSFDVSLGSTGLLGKCLT